MTQREIRSMLRGATKAKIIWSWQKPQDWHVITNELAVMPIAEGTEIETYVSGLYELGVEPMFRHTEPREIDAR